MSPNGISTDWISCGPNREIRFTKLEQGIVVERSDGVRGVMRKDDFTLLMCFIEEVCPLCSIGKLIYLDPEDPSCLTIMCDASFFSTDGKLRISNDPCA